MSALNKFLCPHLSTTFLHRERLVHTLAEATASHVSLDMEEVARYKLILLYAPAGYGKTMAIADFASHTSLACCWYFLDITDNDSTVFLQRLIMSLRRSFPYFGQELDTLLANTITIDTHGQVDEDHFDMIIDKLILLMIKEIHQKFVLIFCNYHAINAYQGINRLVHRLLQALPSHCAMIIESRAIPLLDFEGFLLHHELLVLGSNKLGFTAQEVCDLAQLREVTSLKYEEAEQLVIWFEGWIAGILLGTYLGDIQFLSSQKDSVEDGRFPAKMINRRNLFSYVFNEVFNSEPEIFTFLQHISIRPRIEPDFCNSLLGISDASGRLAYIEQQGLFVTRDSDESNLSYQFHPVLREIFYEELHESNPQKFITLHRQAVYLLQQQGKPLEAIFHAFEAQEYLLAARIIHEISQHMLVRGHSETIATWIDTLPTPIVEQYPQLLLSRANIFLMQYKTDAALDLLEKALAVMNHRPDEDDLKKTLLAEILIAQSFAFFHIGEYEQAQTLCTQAIDLLPQEERTLRALAYQRLGLCMSIMCDSKNGIIQLQQALQLWGHHTVNRQTAFLYGQLAKAYNMIGNYALAEYHRGRAIYCWEQLGDLDGKANNLIGMGVIHLHQGAYSEAESFFDQALTLSRTQKFTRGEAYALINLSELYQELNNYKKALTVVADGLMLARQYQDSYLTTYALCSLATIYLLMDDAQTAHLLLSEIDLKASDMMSYEGCFRDLTRGTILLYQQRYDEAYACLSALESITQKAGWKRRQLQVLIRLAACQLAQGQNTAAIQMVEKAITLARHSEHEHLLQIELRHQPALSQMIQMVPGQQAAQEEKANAAQEESHGWSIQVNQPSLRTLALGVPTVLLENKPITRWRMTKAMELYFFLLDCDYPIHKEQIIAALWPDADDQTDQTFRSAIHYLRKTIGDACVVYHSGIYELNMSLLYGDHLWYDVTEFKTLCTRGRRAVMAEDDVLGQRLFQEAVALYHGDYVQTYYNDWSRFRRDELRRTYVEALTQLAHIAWREQQIDECFQNWRKLLKVDNCHEDAHYGIMRCYMRLGERSQALRQYQQYEEVLREELFTVPGATIQKFYQKLLQHKD